MKLRSGVTLQGGKYRIVKSLGSGGFGITYLAEQPIADRLVCIKEFFPADYYNRESGTNRAYVGSHGSVEAMDKFKTKFIKEAQMIGRLNHPNIIPIYDIFEENNTAYYVMKYVDGGSLGDMVKCGGAMAEVDAVRYIKGVADALAYLHQRSINHLDIKPNNIMILSVDSQPVLIDFGLSKHYDDGGEQTTSTPVGVSHGYAPIEQYKQGGVSSFSPASDIYSLGATLYYLVCGVVPPSATDIGRDGIEIPVSHLSKGVCSAIKSAMSYWREDRPQSVEAFVALLDDVEEDDSLLLEAVVVEDDEKTVLPLSGAKIRVDVSSNNKHVDDGPKPIVNSDESSVKKSDYDAIVVLLLYFFFGVWGVHRVYVGKYFSAICYMFTLAGLGIWALIDLINIVSGNFTDAEGRKVKF